MHHSTKKNILWLIILWAFFICGKLNSQEKENTQIYNDPATEDVKVGLILSGGGAKGLAHIGTLKVIEKSGVRIDYIGGTSMGAIIGALYASGYSARQLDSIFNAVDFDVLIQDDLPRKAKTFYEREDSEKYALTLPFNNFKIGLPEGLSKGQNFYNLFSRLTAHVSEIKDFSKLPIPFFCMATNIENGQQIVLDKGFLPDAVAASGALPSIFRPIELDSILMTDGGVANNYPIKEIKSKGAEVIIGIDVQDSLLPRNDIKSVTDIMLQISNFKTIRDMATKVPETDIYIKPEIKDFSVISFDQGNEIIKNGEKAAFEKYEQLVSLKKRQKPSSPKKIKIENSDKLKINKVFIEGNERYTRAYVKGKLKLKTPTETTYEKFYDGINNLAATGNFDRISYRLIDKPEGKWLALKIKENNNKMLLRFALHYDDLYKTAALINFTKKNLLFDNDVLSVDAILGDNLRYGIDYYIDKGFYWSIGLRHNFNRFNKDIDYNIIKDPFTLPDIEVNKINLDYLDYKSQFYVETLLRKNFSLGLGAEHRWFRLISETIGEDKDQLPRIVFDNTDYWSAFSYLRFDSLDHKYFPTTGFLFDANFNYYPFNNNSEQDIGSFAIAKADFGYAFKISRKSSVYLDLSAGTKIGGQELNSFDFFLGGFGAKMINNNISFYGYDFFNIIGNSYAKALVTLDYEIYSKNHINVSANYANVGDQLFKNGRWFESPGFSGYALGYGIDTFAGPLQVKYTYSPEIKEGEWFFSIGFWF